VWEAIGANGTIVNLNESLTSWVVSNPIRVRPDGSMVIIGTGLVFDGTRLDSIGKLPTAIADAVWLGGGLYTLTARSLNRWDGTTLAPGTSLTLPGTGCRVLATPDSTLLVISVDASGLPTIAVYDSAFRLVPPKHSGSTVPVIFRPRASGGNTETIYDLQGRRIGSAPDICRRRLPNKSTYGECLAVWIAKTGTGGKHVLSK
jgi:hypothetical protein